MFVIEIIFKHDPIVLGVQVKYCGNISWNASIYVSSKNKLQQRGMWGRAGGSKRKLLVVGGT